MFRILKSQLKSFSIIKRTFYDPPRSGYPPIYHNPSENLSFPQRLRQTCQEFNDELKLFVQETRNRFSIHPHFIPPNEDDIVWKFDGTQKSLDQWIVNSDKDYYHGYSISNLELSSNCTGIFHGILDTRIPKDGRTIRAGYCNITTAPKLKSFKRKDHYNWIEYNELVLRIRGDGRCYVINIMTNDYLKETLNTAFHYVMYTRGGPYWQTVRIPFAKFLIGSKGQIYENQYPMVRNNISNIGITISDKKPGPFRLEIDYIAVCFNPSIVETFAYEYYNVSDQ